MKVTLMRLLLLAIVLLLLSCFKAEGLPMERGHGREQCTCSDEKHAQQDLPQVPEPDDFNAEVANSLDKFIELTEETGESRPEDPEVSSNPFFEGDLAISQELINRYYGGRVDNQEDDKFEQALISTVGVREESRRWPGGNVVYVLSRNIPDAVETTIKNAMKVWSLFTCVTFTPWTGQKDFLLFSAMSEHGCFANHVGFKEGTNVIGLELPKCNNLGTLVHEVGHALGLWHEQSRPDRDSYVHIDFDNIREGAERNFRKRSVVEAETQGLTYDYGSIMHYPKDAFSSNFRDTIEVTNRQLYRLQGSPVMGQKTRLSRGDKMAVNRLYKCPEKP